MILKLKNLRKKMYKIVFDIDETVRALGAEIHKRFKIPYSLRGTWWTTYKGLNFYDWVAKDYSVLYEAPTTKYYKIIKSFRNGSLIEFWSHQPKEWQPHTISWLAKHFGDEFYVRFLDREEKYRELKKNKNIILVDDSPFFPSYNRIWLIDQPYNKNIKCLVRIKIIDDLKKLLKGIKNERS